MFVEGVRFVVCAVDAGAEVLGLVVAPKMVRGIGQMLARRLRARGCRRLRPHAGPSSRGFPDGGAGSGTLARSCASRGGGLETRSGKRHPLWVVPVEQVRSQGNLGSILRTGEAVGATGMIVLTPSGEVGRGVDPFDPGVVRATMGSIFGQRIARATRNELRAYAAKTGAPIVGTAPREARDFREVSYRGPVDTDARVRAERAQRGAAGDMPRRGADTDEGPDRLTELGGGGERDALRGVSAEGAPPARHVRERQDRGLRRDE